jgi:hypothetical protein
LFITPRRAKPLFFVQPALNEPPTLTVQAQTLKLPERRRFVSPMPKARDDQTEIPPILTIVAAFAALASLTLSILIYLKK